MRGEKRKKSEEKRPGDRGRADGHGYRLSSSVPVRKRAALQGGKAHAHTLPEVAPSSLFFFVVVVVVVVAAATAATGTFYLSSPSSPGLSLAVKKRTGRLRYRRPKRQDTSER